MNSDVVLTLLKILLVITKLFKEYSNKKLCHMSLRYQKESITAVFLYIRNQVSHQKIFF